MGEKQDKKPRGRFRKNIEKGISADTLGKRSYNSIMLGFMESPV